MADLFENPIGLDGFEFVEFCAPEKGVLEPVFETMGFSACRQPSLEGRASVAPGEHQPHRQLRAEKRSLVFRARARAERLRHGLSRARRRRRL